MVIFKRVLNQNPDGPYSVYGYFEIGIMFSRSANKEIATHKLIFNINTQILYSFIKTFFLYYVILYIDS